MRCAQQVASTACCCTITSSSLKASQGAAAMLNKELHIADWHECFKRRCTVPMISQDVQ